jgi:hypothetical protein
MFSARVRSKVIGGTPMGLGCLIVYVARGFATQRRVVKMVERGK